MKDIERQVILDKIEKLYQQEKHEQIIELITDADRDHNDSYLTLLLARALLDSSVDNEDGMADAAEAVLMMIRGGASDPLWHYQLARSFFFRGRIVEAAREAIKARSLASNNSDYVKIAAELEELYGLCLQELPNYKYSYSKEERSEIFSIISDRFGSITSISDDSDEFGIDIDILEIGADETRPYDTFITMGLGAYDMYENNGEDREPYNSAELMVYIPADWDVNKKNWMKNYMRMIAALPIERKTTLGIGHMFSNGAPISPWTNMVSSVLIAPQDVEREYGYLRLSSGRTIALMQIFPLYREEMEYKLSYGLAALIKRMEHISPIIDLSRENVCLRVDKDSTLLGKEIDLAGDDGRKYCAVSRKIIDEGERVGYMKRHLNVNGSMIADNDSGWVFMAGTETREFLSNPYNIKRCRINTVCNIDSDILPFLNKPYDTTVFRKPDGILAVVNDPPREKNHIPPS